MGGRGIEVSNQGYLQVSDEEDKPCSFYLPCQQKNHLEAVKLETLVGAQPAYSSHFPPSPVLVGLLRPTQ